MSKFKFFSKSILAVSLFVVLFSSCKKEDVNPDYVGTWSAVLNLTENGISMQIKDVITLTNGSYTDLAQLYDGSTGKYIDFVKMKGAMSVNGSIMNITVNEIGMTSFDMLSGKPTGVIAMYKDGTSQFSDIFKLSGHALKFFKSEFSISGNKMTIKMDGNNDGDYADENETVVYTKQ